MGVPMGQRWYTHGCTHGQRYPAMGTLMGVPMGTLMGTPMGTLMGTLLGGGPGARAQAPKSAQSSA